MMLVLLLLLFLLVWWDSLADFLVLVWYWFGFLFSTAKLE